MSRLSPAIRPTAYDLLLKLDPGRDTFEGEVTIHLAVAAEDRLVLHAQGLTISEAWLDERAVGAETLSPDSLSLGPVSAGEHRVRLVYSGGVNMRLRGLYRSLDSEQRSLLVTQMEPNYARLVFPCFDEPAFKAIFRIAVEAPEGLLVLSNSGEQERVGNRVVFAPTPPLSTYLVAVVVGALEVGSSRTVDGIKVRVLATPGRLHLADFAGDVAEFVLQEYGPYFGVPYPTDKLDLIAVPDFGSGAMENLGAIVFRETRLLVDPRRAGREAMVGVAETVAHELAHQWFGDLVTMDWWEDLWLNEAFATWMGTGAVARMKPEWESWLGFARMREEAMELDGLSSSRPVFAPVENPNQMAEMFDLITYVKGASVLKMLEEFLGPEVFRQGVAAYIAEHAFKNARGEDLWRALSQASGRDVAAFTHAWLTRPGYPLLTAERRDGGLEVRQERFLYSGPEPAEPWPVPLWVVYPDRVERVLQSEASAFYPGAHRLLNENGYYRLAQDITAELSPLERLHRALDHWALVKAGRAEWRSFLTLLEQPEPGEQVWEAYLVALRELYLVLGPTPELTRVLRTAGQSAALRSALGTLGEDAGQLDWARQALADPVQRPAALQVVARWGGPEAFAQIESDWRAQGDPDQSFLHLISLTWSPHPELLEKLSCWVLEGQVRPQDGGHVLKAMLMQREGRRVAWPFVAAHWDELVQVLPMQGMRLILQGAAYLAEPLQPTVADFLVPRPVEGGARLLHQSLEQLVVRQGLQARRDQVTA